MTGTRYAWDFSFLWGYRSLILTGLAVTVAYTIGTVPSQCVLEFGCGAVSDHMRILD